MRQALDKTLRNQLESTVLATREVVETACREEIERLGVADATVPAFLNDGQRKLRNRLRAHARQLGDKLHANGEQDTAHLQAEMAYEQWHRMLFARFLEQNNLLMYDAHTPVTLDECSELADDEPDCASGWELAGRLAAKMLPQVFRIDSPVLEVRLAINHQGFTPAKSRLYSGERVEKGARIGFFAQNSIGQGNSCGTVIDVINAGQF